MLKGYYEPSPKAIKRVLGIVLRLKAVEVLEEELVFGALRLMAEKNVDFDDDFFALLVRKENATVHSFDRALRNLVCSSANFA